MIGVDDLLAAMTTWEQSEFTASSVPRATSFRAYKYFPTEAQVAAGIAYPYSVHYVQTSLPEPQSVNHFQTMELDNTHLIWVSIIFGRDGDPYDKLTENSSKWRDAYRTAFLKHLTHGFGMGGGIASNTMGTIEPEAFDLFGRPERGIRIPVTVVVRQSMATAD